MTENRLETAEAQALWVETAPKASANALIDIAHSLRDIRESLNNMDNRQRGGL
jgi:hypothetical protein